MIYSKYSNHSRPKRFDLGRVKKAGLVCFYLTAAILIVLKVATWLHAEELFGLNDVIVEGNHLVTEDEVLALLQPRPGVNLFHYDLRSLGERVENHPYIRRASVGRRLPDKLVVRIEEVEPLALLNGDRMAILDDQGSELPPSMISQVIDYPLIAGMSPDDPAFALVLQYLRDCKCKNFPLYSQISEISYSPDKGVYFYLIDNALPVILGEGNFEEKSRHLMQLLRILEGNQEIGHVEALDVRFENQVVVKSKVS